MCGPCSKVSLWPQFGTEISALRAKLAFSWNVDGVTSAEASTSHSVAVWAALAATEAAWCQPAGTHGVVAHTTALGLPFLVVYACLEYIVLTAFFIDLN